MSARGISSAVRVSINFSLFQTSVKSFVCCFLVVDCGGVVSSSGKDQPRSSTHSPH